jgi:hypothetical protein
MTRKPARDREMAGAEFVVCMPVVAGGPLLCWDNLRAICSHCVVLVQHRPSVPPRLTKLCLTCGASAMEVMGSDVELRVTSMQRREIPERLRRGRQ